jgi:hypothetical protein
MKFLSDVYIISALKVFHWNKDYYLVNENSIDENLADINKPILLLSNGKIVEGWETLKYVLNSNLLTNVYYQIVQKEP